MASQGDDFTTAQEENREATATGRPKVDRNQTNDSNQADPVGSRPLSVSQQEIPHHPGADPTVKSDTPETTTDESATTDAPAGS